MTSDAATPRTGMVHIPGGSFVMGSDEHYPEERPTHRATVEAFWLHPEPVTNDDFATFVAATGHVTAAESAPCPEDYPGVPEERLVPGSAVFRRPPGPVPLSDPSGWWTYIGGADWRHPEGPDSDLTGRGDHPVVHVSYGDALAYAEWAGLRLPTEAEWEIAARPGIDIADRHALANVWRGRFPWDNAHEHRPGTTPVGAYPRDASGVADMIGNVWEWTSSPYRETHDPGGGQACCSHTPAGAHTRRVCKGGSYLCAPEYCARYRPAARIGQPEDSPTGHLGFRCAADA